MQSREQRPLQSSMILPDTNSNVNKRFSAQIEHNFPVPNIKKMQNFINQEAHFQQQSLLLHQPQRQFQAHFPMEEIPQHRPIDPVIHEIYDKLEKLGRTVDKHESQLNSLNLESELSKKVIAEVKKGLPVFTGGNDVYDHLLNMKLEIKNLQEETNKIPKLVDIEQSIKREMHTLKKNQGSQSTGNLSGSNVGSKSFEMDPLLSQMLRKRDEMFQNMLNNIQTEVSIVKKTIGNMNLEMKVSPIVSSSIIILKYQELIKGRNKTENDIVLSENTYYIDTEGYLLDCHSRYIVDQKGKKIKLEDKHISLLKGQKILQ